MTADHLLSVNLHRSDVERRHIVVLRLPMPVAKAPKPVAPVDPRIRAERLFEGGVEGDAR
jgi:hypothetical protein